MRIRVRVGVRVGVRVRQSCGPPMRIMMKANKYMRRYAMVDGPATEPTQVSIRVLSLTLILTMNLTLTHAGNYTGNCLW